MRSEVYSEALPRFSLRASQPLLGLTTMNEARAWLRGAVRLALLGGLLVTGWPVMVAVRVLRRAGLLPPWGPARVFRLSSRAAARILGVRIRKEGPAPEKACVLVSNHLGYMDVIVLASRFDCAFVAMVEVARWPIAGALCRAADTVFVDRDRKRGLPSVIAQIEQSIDRGVNVVIFPEGRSTDGERVLPFRSPLLEVAARAQMPVSYASLAYRTAPGDPPAGQAVCWYHNVPFVRHVLRLVRLRRIEATLRFGEESIQETDRKRLAHRLWQAVEAQLQEAR